MLRNLADCVRRFPTKCIAVVGDVMLDRYTEGVTRRLCQEAPVPVLDVSSQTDVPGGAANTAVNLAELGATTRLLSVVGNDDVAEQLLSLVEQRNVSADFVTSRGRKTLSKRRIAADGHLIVRVDEGSTEAISLSAERSLIEAIRVAADCCDLLVVSDYQYGILTPAVIGVLRQLSDQGHSIVVDSKQLANYRDVRPLAVKPNFAQVQQLLGESICCSRQDRISSLASRRDELLERTGAKIVAATLDRDGALICSRDGAPYRTYAHPSASVNVAGAGDTFLAAFALALAVGAESDVAGDLAAAAAGIVVSQKYTSACSRNALLDSVTGTATVRYTLAELMPLLAARRERQERIVLTSGCFDILHRGHIAYLQQARSLGDALIVGVNCDDTIRRLKGEERPINQLEDRLKVLAALSCVDHLVVFEEDTPHSLSHPFRPEVFVKGGDYTRETLPEAALVEQLGGSVKILPFLDGRSTTRLITRIRSQNRLEHDSATLNGVLSN